MKFLSILSAYALCLGENNEIAHLLDYQYIDQRCCKKIDPKKPTWFFKESPLKKNNKTHCLLFV